MTSALAATHEHHWVTLTFKMRDAKKRGLPYSTVHHTSCFDCGGIFVVDEEGVPFVLTDLRAIPDTAIEVLK